MLTAHVKPTKWGKLVFVALRKDSEALTCNPLHSQIPQLRVQNSKGEWELQTLKVSDVSVSSSTT